MCLLYSIQFNSKTLFTDGDPVRLQLIFPVVIQHVNNTTSFHTYIQNNTDSSDKHMQTQLTLSYKTYPCTLILNWYNVYTNMYIHHTLIIYE